MRRSVHHIARVDLRAVPPAPDQLLETLDRLAAAGFDGFAILYEDSFPWTLDDRMKAPISYPEDVVSGVFDWCQRRELMHCIELTAFGLSDSLLSIPAFSHVRRAVTNGRETSRYESLIESLIEEVIDDVYALVPDSHLLFTPPTAVCEEVSASPLRRCIEAASEAHADSPAFWGLGNATASANPMQPTWSVVTPIGATVSLYEEVTIEVLATNAVEGFGGDVLLPIQAGVCSLERLIAEKTGRPARRGIDESAKAFSSFVDCEERACTALQKTERVVTSAMLEMEPRRFAAVSQADRSLKTCHAQLEELRASGDVLREAIHPTLYELAADRYIATRIGPLVERIRQAESRIEVLRQSLVGQSGTSE